MQEGLIDFGDSHPVVSKPTSKVFAYNGTNVTFAKKDDLVMVNATQMAKPFGKRPVDWLQNKQTEEFLSAITDVRKSTSADFQAVKIVKGGNGEQGTWMHEDVALEFARWLSPAFAIWCNDRIKELLTVGMTATQPTLEAMIDNPDLVIGLANKLKEVRAYNKQLELENKQQAQTIEQQKPKVVFADAVIGSENNILIRDLAKLICQNGYQIGEIRLYRWLRDNKYLTIENKPMQRYVEQGLFYVEEGTHTEKGVMKSHTVTKVTGKGQNYFINKFLAQ